MIRSFALTVPFLLAGAARVSAQAHPIPHPPAPPHASRSDHLALDSAQHALLHGQWKGTLSSAQGIVSGLTLSVVPDSVRHVTFALVADGILRIGAATSLTMRADTLRWTQDLSGAPCVVTAVLSPAAPKVSGAMQGTMACERRVLTFRMQRQTK